MAEKQLLELLLEKREKEKYELVVWGSKEPAQNAEYASQIEFLEDSILISSTLDGIYRNAPKHANSFTAQLNHQGLLAVIYFHVSDEQVKRNIPIQQRKYQVDIQEQEKQLRIENETRRRAVYSTLDAEAE